MAQSGHAAIHDESEVGLALVEPLPAQLPGYYVTSAVAADLCRHSGRFDDAMVHCHSVIVSVRHEPERRFLLRGLAETDSVKSISFCC